MDWKEIAHLVAPFAPTAGRFLGGLVPFPGASIVGGMLGNALATALGADPTPEAVADKIQSMPAEQVQARLEAVESEAKAKWDAMSHIAEVEAADRTAQSQALNETIRTEIATGMSWWHWRNLLGYVPVVIGAEVAGMVPFVALGKITAPDMVAIITAITPLVVTFSGLLGYVAQDTTKLKTTAITGEHAPSATDNVVSAIKKVVGKQPTVNIGKPLGSRD